MKKFLAIVLILVMAAVCLVSCKSEQERPIDVNPPAGETDNIDKPDNTKPQEPDNTEPPKVGSDEKIVDIKTVWDHSALYLTDRGNLYASGDARSNLQLTLDNWDYDSVDTNFIAGNVDKIFTGYINYIYKTKDNEYYIVGSALPFDKEDVSGNEYYYKEPEKLDIDFNVEQALVTTCSIILLDDEGNVYEIKPVQNGFEYTRSNIRKFDIYNLDKPKKIEFDEKIAKISFAHDYGDGVLFLSENGRLYHRGMGAYGEVYIDVLDIEMFYGNKESGREAVKDIINPYVPVKIADDVADIEGCGILKKDGSLYNFHKVITGDLADNLKVEYDFFKIPMPKAVDRLAESENTASYAILAYCGDELYSYGEGGMFETSPLILFKPELRDELRDNYRESRPLKIAPEYLKDYGDFDIKVVRGGFIIKDENGGLYAAGDYNGYRLLMDEYDSIEPVTVEKLLRNID